MRVGKFSGFRWDGLCRTMTFSRGVQTPEDTMEIEDIYDGTSYCIIGILIV